MKDELCLPKLLSLSTAVPQQPLHQETVAAEVRTLFDPRESEVERLQPAFRNAGISTRWTPMPLEWFREPHGWRDRQEVFLPNALDLMQEASEACLAEAGLTPDAVDGLVVACSSGFSTPSLDALLLDRLPFRRNVERLPIFGLGCAGGVLGLARAAALAKAVPRRRILFVSVELCTLTFRVRDQSKSNIIATALFGDGAAAALISSRAEDEGIALAGWGEHTWPGSSDVMGWRVEDDGFGIVFSPDIPKIIYRDFGVAADAFLEQRGLTRQDLAGYVPHPGGEKVVGALERVFGLQQGGLADAREVLQRFGNMSAPTALFVLKRTRERGMQGRYLMAALGPGFTAGFLLLETSGERRRPLQ